MKKVDANHRLITLALRDAGASVQSLAEIGKGCPDILCAFRDVNYVLEVKDGSLPASRKRLTEDEMNWHAMWRGPVHVVESVREALQVIGVLK